MVDKYALNEGIAALAATQGITLTEGALDQITHELAAGFENPSNVVNSVDDASALSYAIFAINTLLHPDASNPSEVNDLERNAEPVIARLITMRNTASA